MHDPGDVELTRVSRGAAIFTPKSQTVPFPDARFVYTFSRLSLIFISLLRTMTEVDVTHFNT